MFRPKRDELENSKSNKKNKQLVLTVLGVIGLVAITAGVTYAFFNYSKSGSTENSITTGSITFLYTEEDGKGRGITIEDAIPTANSIGSTQTNHKFDFNITSTPGNANIKYTVTARKVSAGSDLDGAVDLYLTDQAASDPEEFLQITRFNALQPYKGSSTEKILYEKTISSADTDANGDYAQSFRLRMWIDESINFSMIPASPASCTLNGETVTATDKSDCELKSTTVNEETVYGIWTDAVEAHYPYNGKEFKIIVNVYANDTVASSSSYDASSIGYTTSYNEDVHTIADALDDLNTKIQ